MADEVYRDRNPGAGGETHQIATGDTPVLTTQHGVPVADDQNTLRQGVRGPALLEDFHFREKIFHFDHERIPERVVHARGYGVHGYFECTESLADITRADLFQREGERTPVFVRFSTVIGARGSFDLARDVRGFATKFYTKEGIWDLVANNIPVFFIQDPIKFPDMVHAAKPAPDRHFPQAQTAHDNFWDFISLSPESMHMVMWIMSDRTIPRSYRFMEGFGVHTFRFLTQDGRSTYVKFHWKPKLGLQSVVWNEAVKINGADPDFHRRDLWDAILTGDPPEWELGVQLFDDDFADQFQFDILDPTKIIPEEQVPIRVVGRLVLDQVVDNFFHETEQVAFCTQNVPPGIGFTNDPLLQGRNFSYLDTQLKRLGGPNFTQIPINQPRGCPVMNFQQDGHMNMRNPKGRANYEPNSWGEGPRESPEKGYRHFAEVAHGDKRQVRPETFADHYSQARQFYVSQTAIEQKHIGDALVFELSRCERPDIRARTVSHLRNIDEDLAATVADGLGMELPPAAPAFRPPIADLPPSDPLSILKRLPPSFRGRKVGVVIADGTDRRLLGKLIAAIEAEGALYEIIAPKVGGAVLDDGTLQEAKHKIDGAPSVLYDAVAVLVSSEGAALLSMDKPSKDFVSDAFAHCKVIGHTAAAAILFEKAGITASDVDQGFVPLEEGGDARTFIDACAAGRIWSRELRVDLDAIS